jgi:hypothetical protein
MRKWHVCQWSLLIIYYVNNLTVDPVECKDGSDMDAEFEELPCVSYYFSSSEASSTYFFKPILLKYLDWS